MNKKKNELWEVIEKHKKAFIAVMLFSLIANFLYLTPSIYMMQVYDRVMMSRSEFTLLMLSLLAIGIYLFIGVIDYIKGKVLIRVGNALDDELSARVFTATFESNLRSGKFVNNIQSISDLTTLRQYLTGPGILAIMDVPWTPIYVVVVFLMHPYLGFLSLFGLIILGLLTYAGSRLTNKDLLEANNKNLEANQFASASLKNSDVIESMGMLQPLMKKWKNRHTSMLHHQSIASDRGSAIQAATKSIRLLMQSAVLALGVLLYIEGHATGGMMIAASILVGRATAPIEALIGSWKMLIAARESFHRLSALLDAYPVRKEGVDLPSPRGQLSMEGVFVSAPGAKTHILKNINLAILPGEVIGVVGPSASGKSTLARAMIGAWHPQNGVVRLDGANIADWNKSELGPYLGFLPQEIELFEGTVAENIARHGEVDSQKTIRAAQLAGIHQIILKLPQGYETEIGISGAVLSGGQRQRLGIARALYGDPTLVVLDEPNSNLDEAGEIGLVNTIKFLKQNKKTVVLITHKLGILQLVDKLVLLKDGQVQLFDTKERVLNSITEARQLAKKTDNN